MTNLRILLPLVASVAATAAFAQPNRIVSTIDNTQRVILGGHVHPLVNPSNDAGAVDSSFPLPFMTLMLKPTADQQASLAQLLQDLQDPSSPSFRQWLTPEQYADRFGASAGDVGQIVAWLQSEGFTVNPVSRSRTYLTFGGTAGQVQQAIGTAIHHYRVNGKMHYANATDPKVPAALAPLVSGFRGLSDFRLKSHAVARPLWTGPDSGTPYALAPDDFATIYDVTPLYNMTPAINGSGVTIVIPGEAQLYRSGSDVTSFWSRYGSSAKLTQTYVGPPGQNPGPAGEYQGDLDESTLDTEWAGAVARGATIAFVYSTDAWSSAVYAVDNKLGQVLSISYGACEAFDLADLAGYRQTVQLANAEGMTFVAAAGDAGAADCDQILAPSTVASGGLAVDEPGSIPEVIAMGGTQISLGANYWSNTNSSTEESAKPYRGGEESVWNDIAASIANGQGILAGGGGASMFFPQPPWQSGIVPSDGWRHVPDLSFNASVYNTPYAVGCSSFQYCLQTDGSYEFLGGTSGGAPTMAGIVAILNQYLGANGLGNINPALYALSQSSAATSVFHDITSGNNIVPCAYASPGCNNGQEGYSATTGYDSATGLGSLDVTNFVQQWHTAAPTGAVVVPSVDQDPVYQGLTEGCGNLNTWNFKLTLTEAAGIGATVTGFTINGTDESSQIRAIFATSSLSARQSISGCYSLSGLSVPVNETLSFSGTDANGNQWQSAITVPFQASLAPLAITKVENSASYNNTAAPGSLIAVIGSGLGSTAQVASVTPFPFFMQGFYAMMCPGNCNTGQPYPVPLYYVSPVQANVQVPFEITGRAQLYVFSPYEPNGIAYNFTVTATAPGIYTLLDGSNRVSNGVSTSGTRGQLYTIYITGQGAVSPQVDDGYSPASDGLTQAPKPVAPVSLTVGGVPVSTTDANWYIAIPDWSVGVTQINFTIPSTAPTGSQPIVVTIGGVQSLPAYVTVQ